jgi:ribosomal protein S6--L-glutamate ligase
MHCGHGVRRWDSVETVYSFVALSESSYPFVLQPFLEQFTDVRVVIVGDYLEAYVRHNPNNFRMNISFGGKNYPYQLEKEEEDFCRVIMARGKFPFAHVDLQITEDGKCYLSEIALDGGTKGASISRQELEVKKQRLLEELAKV